MHTNRDQLEERYAFGKKADLENMGKQLETEFSKFNTTEFKDISTMWSSVKQLITESINKHVPTKRTLARHSLPWMNTRLRRLCKPS
jgi:hypothetical protein